MKKYSCKSLVNCIMIREFYDYFTRQREIKDLSA